MNTAQPSADAELNRLQVLYGLKRLLGRDGESNVTPFTEHQVIGYQTDVAGYDVPEIHQQQRQLIEQAVGEVLSRRCARVILLSGNPGMGKSHLLNYFRRPEVARRLNYLFVSATNHWDIGDFEERLLDSLLDALVRPSPNERHPLLERVEAIAFSALDHLLRQPVGRSGQHQHQRRALPHVQLGGQVGHLDGHGRGHGRTSRKGGQGSFLRWVGSPVWCGRGGVLAPVGALTGASRTQPRPHPGQTPSPGARIRTAATRRTAPPPRRPRRRTAW